MDQGVTLRPVRLADAPDLAAIYGHYCLHGLGTFEEVAPTAETMADRVAAILDHDLPYLVAEEAGQVVAYAYASVFRPRTGYRFSVEDSVYVAPGRSGQGLGKTVLAPVIAACEARGLRQMFAVIGDSGNIGSIALHRSLGFTHQGVGRSLGYKRGRWVDIVFMQRALGAGEATPPDGGGLAL